jgi:hypothetical protein
VKVFQSKELAEQEASRLREVNKGKQSTYAVQVTRFVDSWVESSRLQEQ